MSIDPLCNPFMIFLDELHIARPAKSWIKPDLLIGICALCTYKSLLIFFRVLMDFKY